jgi:acyl-CoA reductase-like NAD-dependent aldehyde dehydrogenase
MKVQEAFSSLRPESWAITPIKERLRLLRQIQHNMALYAEEIASPEGAMKNSIVGADAYSRGFNLFGTVGQMGSVVGATIELYESLARGKMPQALEVIQVNDEIYGVKVFPQTGKEKLMAGKQHGHLRVKGEPKQISPMDKPVGVIAVLGAGNYSSSLEMVKALFWENKAVIHRPHQLNAASDAVWQKIFAPLVEIGALAYCDADQGRELTTLRGLTAIYFTGGTETARAIMAATDTPLVAECGGNNPCIVVPGDRLWTEKELKHQAEKIVSMAKMNGGAVCGRCYCSAKLTPSKCSAKMSLYGQKSDDEAKRTEAITNAATDRGEADDS